MGNCIICGTPVDGHICSSHEEDAVFEFEGNSPEQLTPGRYYEGTVDGYAEFGVFVDIGDHVTGLLHRSELDRRLDSLDWDAGDTVYVQVTDVRDNGNVDLGWSIRQRKREFRGHLVQTPQGDELPEGDDGDDDHPSDSTSRSGNTETRTPSSEDAQPEPTDEDDAPSAGEAENTDQTTTDEATSEVATDEASADTSADAPSADAAADEDDAPSAGDEATSDVTATSAVEDAGASESGDVATDDESTDSDEDDAPVGDEAATADESASEGLSRTALGDVADDVGQVVRVEGEVVSIRQTSGPTVFEVRDESDVVEAAAFESAGVRAYPDVEVDDVVRIDGEVERHHDDLQIETEVLDVLEGEEADVVRTRLADALAAEADPGEVDLLADHDAVAAVESEIRDVASTIRQAVFTGRPVVVRHTATADGYVAGAAIERAVLPLVREEHAREDAEYHFFERRPLDDPFYGMDAATDDVTDMLGDRERHGEQFPLVVLADAGSTAESEEGYEFLDVYGVERVAIDATYPDDAVLDDLSAVVNPHVAGVDDEVSSTALAANVAAHVNDDVRVDLSHLPAVSYWEDTPEVYVDLARDADYDVDDVTELRQAMALEAFYQSYKDKRELVDDLLFGRREGLSGHVSDQFREKMRKEVETARRNLTERTADGVTFAVVDTDAFTHRFDFPPEALLVDELHRTLREEYDEPVVTIGLGGDDMRLRSDEDLDVRRVAEQAASTVPEAGIEVVGGREGHVEYLAGERDAVQNAVIAAIAKTFKPA
ncbi:S1 RNA-binding domain-containing protein [Halorubellus sp. JP-L1]|uniref:DHH family phosphoesterase n=1 Tax=Halorubellus sp. JP-L1 TaxID=2715753 RepID=UPI0014094EF2|nr:OB-fold nucleic acid binding domain-containing protein [Halorubellus sp. JP-L1]NHN40872.1 S1 RNA-binding domain-containing protein [Halorubellus sp. JP-L1]